MRMQRRNEETALARRAKSKPQRQATPKGEDEAKKSKGREYFESLVVAIILALFVKTFVLQTFQIPTGSMQDNLLVGDHIIVNKMIYGPEDGPLNAVLPMREVERGDVVIFKFPPEPQVDYIKRVIGLPGEEVRITGHQVYINGTPIEELGLDEDRYTLQWRRPDRERAARIGADNTYNPETAPSALANQVFRVPAGHYFMMGDHRSISRDSRAWGTVPREHITGRAVMIYWSCNATREDYRQTNFGQQVVNTIRSILTLPFNTRWERLFRIIR